MSQLERFLYPAPDIRRTPTSLVRWWERRRLRYNLVVGATGVLTLMVVQLFSTLPPGLPAIPLLPGVLIYGCLANLCYSAGWISELGMRMLWRDQAPPAGPVLWRQGLLFSVGLTLMPAVLAAAAWALRLALLILT